MKEYKQFINEKEYIIIDISDKIRYLKYHHVMSEYYNSEGINWGIYWSLYKHTDLSPIEALFESITV